jgi:hypothetical protein
MSMAVRVLLVIREQQMLYYIWKVILLLLKNVSPHVYRGATMIMWLRMLLLKLGQGYLFVYHSVCLVFYK